MKLFYIGKDGGSASLVWGYWLCEFKSLFSICILQFKKGSRESFHNHAFNAVSWVLWGHLKEETMEGEIVHYKPSLIPIYTPRKRFHRVFGMSENTFVITFRGSWKDRWNEFFPRTKKFINLTHGRKIV